MMLADDQDAPASPDDPPDRTTTDHVRVTPTPSRRASFLAPLRNLLHRPATSSPPSSDDASTGDARTNPILTPSPQLCKKYGNPTCLLGSGAHAHCFLVRRPTDNKLFAVKRFRDPKQGVSKREYVTALMNEFAIASALKHVNIVETVDMVFEREGRVWEVMELLPTPDLFTLLTPGPLPSTIATCLTTQLLRGLSYIHAHHIAHRDLKPENIRFSADGTLKVIDFGCAAVVRYPGEYRERLCTGVCGSGPYVAPEVWEGDGYNGLGVDVWSAAIIHLAMTLHRFPWAVATPNDARFAQYREFSEDRAPLPKFLRRLDGEAARVVRAMLEIDARKRIGVEKVLASAWLRGKGCVGAHVCGWENVVGGACEGLIVD